MVSEEVLKVKEAYRDEASEISQLVNYCILGGRFLSRELRLISEPPTKTRSGFGEEGRFISHFYTGLNLEHLN